MQFALFRAVQYIYIYLDTDKCLCCHVLPAVCCCSWFFGYAAFLFTHRHLWAFCI